MMKGLHTHFSLSYLLLSTALFFPSLLSSVSHIQADRVQYEQERLTLEGHVQLTTDLGQMEAKRGYLTSSPHPRTRRLQLFDQVKLQLKDLGTLHCQKADLHPHQLEGTFMGGEGEDLVTFQSAFSSSEESWSALQLSSDQLTLHGGRTSLGQRFLASLVAQGRVTCEGEEGLQVRADRAIYRYQPEHTWESAPSLGGVVYFTPQASPGVCEVTRNQGDRVRGQLIRMDLEKKNLYFDRPVGTLYFLEKEGPLKRLDFSSTALLWDEKHLLLELQGEVKLEELGMGQLHTEKTIFAQFIMSEGERQLASLETKGLTTLSISLDEELPPYRLTSFSGIHIDHQSLTAFMEAPEGHPDKQVAFHTPQGTIHADTATLSYRQGVKSLHLERITIHGNVTLANQSLQGSKNSPSVLQYAKADSLEFDPQTQELFLQGKGRRVLFFDKLNHVQVSAPALKMSQDPLTGKQAIQGVGDVRFRLIGQEMKELLAPFEEQQQPNMEEPPL